MVGDLVARQLHDQVVEAGEALNHGLNGCQVEDLERHTESLHHWKSAAGLAVMK